jgi:hypothetical protein
VICRVATCYVIRLTDKTQNISSLLILVLNFRPQFQSNYLSRQIQFQPKDFAECSVCCRTVVEKKMKLQMKKDGGECGVANFAGARFSQTFLN